jgi:hypothetical protein
VLDTATGIEADVTALFAPAEAEARA